MNPVREALAAVLLADTELTGLLGQPDGVYYQKAPAGALEPYVVFNRQGGTPSWTMRGPPLEDDRWLVKAVSRADPGTAEDAAARLDVVLNDAPLQITGQATLYLRRASRVEYPENDGTHTYHHAGAIYRLVTETA